MNALTPWEKLLLGRHLAAMNPNEIREQRCELRAILVADLIVFTLLGLLLWAVWR